MNKKEMIRKWLKDNQNKKIWIKQFAYNMSFDIIMNKGYRLQEPIKNHFLLTNNNEENTIDIMLFDTDEENINIGYDEETFGAEAQDFEADFEIELEHGMLLFILQ